MAEGRDPLSAYLLGEMGPQEAEAFERRMRRDPQLRAEVEKLRPLVAEVESITAEVGGLPDLAAESEPPAPVPSGRRRLSWPRVVILRPLTATALATLLLAIGVTAGAVIAGGGGGGAGGGATSNLSRVGSGPDGARGSVQVDERGSAVALAVEGLEPSGPGGLYELWLRDPGDRGAVLGAFPVGADGTARAWLPLPRPPSSDSFFDVSPQRGGVDPGGSGASVLRGPTPAPRR